MGIRFHTSAYTAHRVAMAGKHWFTGKLRSKMSLHNINSLFIFVTVLPAGFKCRVKGVDDFVVVAREWWSLQAN